MATLVLPVTATQRVQIVITIVEFFSAGWQSTFSTLGRREVTRDLNMHFFRTNKLGLTEFTVASVHLKCIDRWKKLCQCAKDWVKYFLRYILQRYDDGRAKKLLARARSYRHWLLKTCFGRNRHCCRENTHRSQFWKRRLRWRSTINFCLFELFEFCRHHALSNSVGHINSMTCLTHGCIKVNLFCHVCWF